MNSSWSTIETFLSEEELTSLQLCFCEDNKLHQFDECYLSCEIKKLEDYPINCVNPACFKKSYSETNIAQFLQSHFYLQEFGSNHLATFLCQEFDKSPDKSINYIKYFYDFYKKDNSVVHILSRYKILMSDKGKWAIPAAFYIPEEINDTINNISIYYDFQNTKTQAQVVKLSPQYKELFEDKEELHKFYIFLTKLGCKYNLPVEPDNCRNNPNWKTIYNNAEADEHSNSYVTNYDYKIPYFDAFLARPMNEAVFELIISAITNLDSNCRQCRYSPASKYKTRYYPSQIACSLSKAKWFIQENNGKYYFVKPEDVVISKIPSKYKSLIDEYSLESWLKLMDFGSTEVLKSEKVEQENEILTSIGFDDESIDIFRKFNNSNIPVEKREEVFNTLKSYIQNCLTEGFYQGDDIDIDRLNDKSADAFNEANDMTYEDRNRRIRKIDPQKILAEPFLREVCVDEDGRIHCQICRNLMPFKRLDGLDYFERIQLFPKNLIKKELKENYIACCPVCAAKMKVLYHHNPDSQKALFKQILYSQENIDTFPIMLDKEERILFAKRHIVALRKMIEESQKE